MKTIAALPLLALALMACDPYYGQQPGYPPSYPQDPQGYPPYPSGPPMPPGAPYPGPGQPMPVPPAPVGEATYRAIGTEPFWDLEIGRDLVFTDRGNDLRVVQPAPPPIQGTTFTTYRTQRLDVRITHTPCSDGMSDRRYPDTVQVYVDRQLYRGCGAPIAFFSQIGEDGQPNDPGLPAMDLRGTNWRVTAINGRPTPPSNYYINFMPDRIGAKFGCNSLGAGYTQNGNILDTDAVIATRMACPDMRFENQGSRILERPMTVSGVGNRLTLSNQAGTIDLIRAN
jgi:heat shock protein HslJ